MKLSLILDLMLILVSQINCDNSLVSSDPLVISFIFLLSAMLTHIALANNSILGFQRMPEVTGKTEAIFSHLMLSTEKVRKIQFWTLGLQALCNFSDFGVISGPSVGNLFINLVILILLLM